MSTPIFDQLREWSHHRNTETPATEIVTEGQDSERETFDFFKETPAPVHGNQARHSDTAPVKEN